MNEFQSGESEKNLDSSFCPARVKSILFNERIERRMIMTPKTLRIAKFVVSVIGAGLTLVSKQNMDKVLDEKIAKKVAEELSKRNK